MKGDHWGHRDATMVLIAFRHGLRASELVDLRWDQIDLEHAILHVRKLKNGSPATHPLTGKELRALRRLQREQDLKSPFVFTSERGTPFSKRGLPAMVERAGEAAGFDMKIHPHMLRHACGFKLANDGVDTRTIQTISATSRSSIRCVTPSWRRRGSKAYSGLISCSGFEIKKGPILFKLKKVEVPKPLGSHARNDASNRTKDHP